LTALSKKSGKIAALIAGCQGGALDAHYLGYFECFNRAEFYEAHDVLEELWLAQRRGPNGPFFKGLIQFAGAFVHLQKHEENRPRLRPSAALFKLARTHLLPYAPAHEQLDVSRLIEFMNAQASDLSLTSPTGLNCQLGAGEDAPLTWRKAQ